MISVDLLIIESHFIRKKIDKIVVKDEYMYEYTSVKIIHLQNSTPALLTIIHLS